MPHRHLETKTVENGVRIRFLKQPRFSNSEVTLVKRNLLTLCHPMGSRQDPSAESSSDTKSSVQKAAPEPNQLCPWVELHTAVHRMCLLQLASLNWG